MTPTISAYLLNYNYEHYLPKAIIAILEQTALPLEFVIIDDASTDNSLKIIESLIQNVPFARVVQHKQNQGVIRSINEAITTCRGDYLYLGSSDDWIEPDLFYRSLQLIKSHPNIGLTTASPFYHTNDQSKPYYFTSASRISRHRFANRTQNSLSPQKEEHHPTPPDYAITNGVPTIIYPHELKKLIIETNFSIATVTTIYKTSLLVQYGLFDERLQGLSDWYMMFYIASKHPIGFIPYHLGTTRIHCHSYSAGIHKNKENQEKLFDWFVQKITEDQDFNRFMISSGLSVYIQAFGKYIIKHPSLWRHLPNFCKKSALQKIKKLTGIIQKKILRSSPAI